MTDSEKKNKILKLALEDEWSIGAFTIIERILPDSSEEEIIELLLQIAEIQPPVASVSLQADSESIHSNGRTRIFLSNDGFVGLDEQNEKIEQQESKEEEKLKIDLQLAKWQRLAFWPIFVFGLFGGVYGFIDIIDTQSKQEDTKQIKQSIEQMESELSKLRTSLSDQKTDTLSHSSSSDKKE